jgi:hypothetical protein
VAVAQDDDRLDRLAPGLVRNADDDRLVDRGVAVERLLELRRIDVETSAEKAWALKSGSHQ